MARVFAFAHRDNGRAVIKMNGEELFKFGSACDKAGAKHAGVLILDLLSFACEHNSPSVSLDEVTAKSPRWSNENMAKNLEVSLNHLEKIGFLSRDGDTVILDADAIHASRIVALPERSDA